MSSPPHRSIEELEDQLEGAERTLSGLGTLSEQHVERVALRMDRLASQLLAVSRPHAMAAVHARVGTTPASIEDFDSLADRMGPPDREG